MTDPGILNKIKANNEYRFTTGEYVGVGVIFHTGNINYTVMATAIDRLGIAELGRLRKILLYSGLVGVFITLLVGHFFSTGLLRPPSQINKEMNDISLQNISKRVEINNKKDELNELAQTFNNLLDRLEVSINNQSRLFPMPHTGYLLR